MSAWGDEQYTRLDVSLASPTPQGETVNSAVDDAIQGNLKALQDKANQLIASQKTEIQSLAAELAKLKAKVQPQTSPPDDKLAFKVTRSERKLVQRS